MKVEIRVQPQPSLFFFSTMYCLTLPGSAYPMKVEARRWFQQHSVVLSSLGTLGISVKRFGDISERDAVGGVVQMHEIVPQKI